MAVQLHEADLRPYQTYFVFASAKSLHRNNSDKLFARLSHLVDYGIDERYRPKVLATRKLRNFGDVEIGWLVYSRTFPVTWASGTNAPENTEHHWLAMIVRGALVSVVSTDRAFGSRLHRTAGSDPQWRDLCKVPHERIEAALVRGSARTLWLSGIHRSVTTKADSKILMGPDLEASLDALGDQSYHYTSTRCTGPEGSFTSATVGVTPRQAKIWLGPTIHWEAFVANSRSLLKLLESGLKPHTPYPVLARAHDSLTKISEAFDISLTRPEALLRLT